MEHFYKSIPGWFSFRSVYEDAVREASDGAHFVEVGCWKGRSAAFMAVEIINSGKKIRFDCVDTWLGSNEPKHVADPSVKNGTLYTEFRHNLKPVSDAVFSYCAESAAFAKTYFDRQLDFVFIDAAHDYANVAADLAAWWPKVKLGGVLAGDDFKFKGVNRAVLEFFLHLAPIEQIKGTGSGWAWRVRK